MLSWVGGASTRRPSTSTESTADSCAFGPERRHGLSGRDAGIWDRMRLNLMVCHKTPAQNSLSVLDGWSFMRSQSHKAPIICPKPGLSCGRHVPSP